MNHIFGAWLSIPDWVLLHVVFYKRGLPLISFMDIWFSNFCFNQTHFFTFLRE